MKRQAIKLVPPDPKQCQANKLTGCWPDAQHFMALGSGEIEQCANKPCVIITEKKKNPKDGLVGSMSLCIDCWAEAIKQLGAETFTVKPIPEKGHP